MGQTKNADSQRRFAVVKEQICCLDFGGYAENGYIMSQKGNDKLKFESTIRDIDNICLHMFTSAIIYPIKKSDNSARTWSVDIH